MDIFKGSYLFTSTKRESSVLTIAIEALKQIAANTSDCGRKKGKTGNAWIAAACGELAWEALSKIEGGKP